MTQGIDVRRFYVYHLVDPRNQEVFYVGKGTGPRIRDHEVEARRGVTSEKCNRIRNIWDDKLPIERRVVALFESEVEALRFEAAEIMRWPNLTNVAFPKQRRSIRFRVTEDFLPRLAFLLRATNGLRNEIELHYSESIGPVGDAVNAIFNRMGVRKLTEKWTRAWIENEGIESVNARLAPYEIAIV